MATAAKKEARPADTLQVKPYVDRVKALLISQKEIGADVTAVCQEARDVAGLDPATLRFVAREAIMETGKRQERDSKRAEYLHALGLAVAAVESGELSARQSAKLYSIGKTSIYNELAVRALSADPETGELPRDMVAGDLGEWTITETAELDTPPGGDQGTADVTTAQPKVAASLIPASTVWQRLTQAEAERVAKIEADKEAARQRRRAEREARDALNARVDSDPLDIPPFLKRERAA